MHFNTSTIFISKIIPVNISFGIAGETLPCAAGYVCLGGSDVATPTDGVMGYPCPVGNYCPEGSTMEIPCNKGSYAPAIAMGVLQ